MLAPATAVLIDQLSAEHAELLPSTARLAELAQARSPELAAMVERCRPLLGPALDAHIEHEDNVLFPAYAGQTGEGGLTEPFREEHREILALRNDLFALHAAGAAQAERLAKVAARLADLLHEHMVREDHMLFPAIRDALA